MNIIKIERENEKIIGVNYKFMLSLFYFEE